MTLGEIVGLVSDKVNMTDAKTKALVRRFAARRHEMIARMGLWRELLGLYRVTAKAGQLELTLPAQVSTLVALRTDTENVLPVDATYAFMTDPSLWQRIGTPRVFHQLPSVATRLAPLGQALSVESTHAGDIEGDVVVEGEWSGDRRWAQVALAGTTPVTTSVHFDVVYSITKPLNVQGDLIISRAGDGVRIGELLGSELVRRYRRIRLLETPKEDVPLVVLAKRRVHPLREDGDSTAFAGMDLALEAFVLADTYEWLRQMQDAQEKRQEAMAMLDVLKREEFYQEAGQQRLVPQVWGSETSEYSGLHGGM